MKPMYISKIAASFVLAAVLLASCGSKDKSAELNDLKAKRSELDGKISALEQELGITNAVKARKIMTTDVVASPFKHCVEIQGTVDAENNVVVNAPHTAQMVISDSWNKPYGREKAAFPLNWIAENKFWPSVGKVDNAYGDRNLVCSCAPIEAYANA
jgi:outer membrane murein-binding lipoprotein Lpp